MGGRGISGTLTWNPAQPSALLKPGMKAHAGLYCQQRASYQAPSLAKVIGRLDARGRQGRQISIRELTAYPAALTG